MTAAALPVRRGRLFGTGRAGWSSSDTFCRFERRADGALIGSGSVTGLDSPRAGALRFLVEVEGACRVGVVAGRGVVVEGEVSKEVIACRAEDRVVLDDMSMTLYTMHPTAVTS